MNTICALATSPLEAAISIIRISGKDSYKVLNKVFKGKKEKIEPRIFYYGHIYKEEKILDEVMVVYFKAPYSYTKEDIVEIHTHGGNISSKRIIELLLDNGIYPAEPGEFSKRAFLNGRIDLSQAEAVIDLIKAKTELSFDIALDHLEGDVIKEIKNLREKVLDILAELVVSIDYPEEDIEMITYNKLFTLVLELEEILKNLIEDSKKAFIIKDGIKIALIGRTNVGKSSLLNAITKKQRAIVTDIEGTTRDTIEENIIINNIPITLVDTAGIRESIDLVEKIGIEKTKKEIILADILFFIVDSSKDLSNEELELLKKIKDKRKIIIINKTDLDKKLNQEVFYPFVDKSDIIEISALKNENIEKIEKRLLDIFKLENLDMNSTFISSLRQINEIKKAYESVKDLKKGINEEIAYDFLEVDLKNIYDLLGSVIGEDISTNHINEIFKKFCLGK